MQKFRRFLTKKFPLVLAGYVLVLGLVYATLSILRHNRFESGGFDLGLYDQAVWQYSRFLAPYNTIKDRFILGDHLTLTLPLLSPLYWLKNDVRMLLVFQAFWISISAIAVYLLGRSRQFSKFTSTVVAVVYSLFYGIQYAVFFDFHPVVIGVGLLVWFLYFFETRKRIPATVAGILLLLTQENMGLLLAAVGFVYVFHKPFRKAAVFFILFGISVSLLASRVIALISPSGFEYWPQIAANPLALVQQFFDAGEKQQVWRYTLAAFSFLPLLSPGAMLAIFFDLGQYFVTGPEFSRMWSPFMHHRISLAPLVALGALDGLRFLRKKNINLTLVSVVLLAVTAVNQYALHLALNKLTKKEFWTMPAFVNDNRDLIKTLTPDMRIATTQNLAPHITHRSFVYLVWPREHDFDDNRCGQRSCWWLDFDAKTDYLLVDARPHQWLTQILETNEHFLEALANMENAGIITEVRRLGFARLYRVHR